MYRMVIKEQVIYGRFRDYFATAQEMMAYNRSKGWADYSAYMPVAGAGNDVVYHADYPSLAAFEAEMKLVMADAGFAELMRRQAPHIVQGSSVSEILMTLDDDVV